MSGTSENRTTWDFVKEALQITAALLLITTALAGFGLWLTGGLRPQTQVDVDNLTRKVDGVQTDVAAIKKQLGDQPRPSDWSALEARVASHDQQFRDVGDRQTRDEIDAADIRSRVTRLDSGTNAATRNPR